MALTKKLWSLNALEVETGRDRRTIGKALAGVPRDGTIGKNDAWHLSTALAALDRHDLPNGRSGDLDPAQERARKDRALAEQTEMRNDIARGSVVLIEDVARVVTGEYAIVRTRMLAMASKIAARLPHDERQRIASLVSAEVNAALAELSADETPLPGAKKA
jgi:phage terminase Nu1 subunit (DNA packaging protein)